MLLPQRGAKLTLTLFSSLTWIFLILPRFSAHGLCQRQLNCEILTYLLALPSSRRPKLAINRKQACYFPIFSRSRSQTFLEVNCMFFHLVPLLSLGRILVSFLPIFLLDLLIYLLTYIQKRCDYLLDFNS